MKELWILIGKLWYNQIKRNDAKGYITFENIFVEDSNEK
jgi:hypothetical protein